MLRGSKLPIDTIAIDAASEIPLYRQLYELLRTAILDGGMKAGMRLPSSRLLARDLGLSRNTVVATYDALLAEGYLEARRGSGTFVASLSESAMRARETRSDQRLPPLSRRGALMSVQPREGTVPEQVAFHPGFPEMRSFPFSTWAKLMASNSRHASGDILGYSAISGHPRLKAAIADYLAVSRGVKCDPEQIIVVSGAQAALDIIGRLLLDEGDPFWMEDPGYAGATSAFLSAGGRPVSLPVGQDGWKLDEAGQDAPRLIFVTPSCQWPLGIVMQMEERLRLLEIASRHNSWIIEDDYDSEYRFRGHPIPALQGLDRSGRVIYVGTFAKTMLPSLRIGFIVVPEALIGGFMRAVNITGQHPSPMLQVALADFIAQGFFTKHLRRMRNLYAQRQHYFVAQCREHLDAWLTVEEIDTGIQIVGRLKDGLKDAAVLDAARRHNVTFSRLSAQYRQVEPEQGLLLGYASTDEAATRLGIRRLQSAFRELA